MDSDEEWDEQQRDFTPRELALLLVLEVMCRVRKEMGEELTTDDVVRGLRMVMEKVQ